MNNPLLDNEFLDKLHQYRQRELYAKITLLTNNELPIESVEGRITGGSISVDGNSALRRTCNITMILPNQKEINQFNWAFKQKFKLEIGLKNVVNKNYPDIIWFKQGIFILTTFNMSQSTNNYTITLNGKDKMCLLNGDIGGILPHSVDFGQEEYVDIKNGTVDKNDIPIKDIIRNAISYFGGELPENIIINDLDDAGYELIEYRADFPLYLFRDIKNNTIINCTIDEDHEVYINNNKIKVSDESIVYSQLSGLISNNPTEVTLVPNDSNHYHIIKLEYGDLAGYRLTDLVYGGKLEANIGDSITSVFDKIKNALGNFEYFYNLDGRFVFQRKKSFISTPWGGVESDKDDIINEALKDSYPHINLNNAELITSFGNNPNLLNVKNDFVVWGTYKSTSGVDLPIHMRYALDTKPFYYKAFDGKEYTTEEWDWREIIYQMALDYRKHCLEDDFYQKVAAANPNHFPTGRTGYEQYYTDLEGFWRQIYNPNPEPDFYEIDAESIQGKSANNVYLKSYHSIIPKEKLKDNDGKIIYPYDLSNLYVTETISVKDSSGESYNKIVFYPFIGSSECCLNTFKDDQMKYFYQSGGSWKEAFLEKDKSILNSQKLDSIYCQQKNSNTKILFIKYAYEKLVENSQKNLWIVKEEDTISFDELNNECKKVYCGGTQDNLDNKEYAQYIYAWSIIDNYGTKSSDMETSLRITYYKKDENGSYDPESYWHKDVIDNPGALLFWFDFLETEGSDLYKYSVREIGIRTKAVNDNNVKSIYYRDVPNIIFVQDLQQEIYGAQPGYTSVQLPIAYDSLFTISDKGKSAKERIDELLEAHSYCIESSTITSIPIYNLEPNTKISIIDEKSNINGEYLVSKITIPLTYNGTMNITATKVVSNII